MMPVPSTAVMDDQYAFRSREYAFECPMKLLNWQFCIVPDPPLDFIMNIWLEDQV